MSKIFLSWSKETSRRIANVFNQSIRLFLPNSTPFFSGESIRAERWSPAVREGLREADAGIFFLTRESIAQPWLNFEAGALITNAVDQEEGRIFPILFDLKIEELEGSPFREYQAFEFSKDSIRQVFEQINNKSAKSAEEHTLFARRFEKLWPMLEEDIQAVRNETRCTTRSQRDLLEDILEESRAARAAIIDRLHIAFKHLPQHKQVLMFLDSIARQDRWTFYPPRKNETEFGNTLGMLLKGLINNQKDVEKADLRKYILDWLNSSDENLIFFGSEVIGFFNAEFIEVEDSLFEDQLHKIYYTLPKNQTWKAHELNCLWAHSRLTNFDELNKMLRESCCEDNKIWILEVYEQMIKANDLYEKERVNEFLPVLEEVKNADPSQLIREKANNVLNNLNKLTLVK